jgi:hypothetical protein
MKKCYLHRYIDVNRVLFNAQLLSKISGMEKRVLARQASPTGKKVYVTNAYW